LRLAEPLRTLEKSSERAPRARELEKRRATSTLEDVERIIILIIVVEDPSSYR
jgi:hypothetical protein